jgi:5'-3' exonuclease
MGIKDLNHFLLKHCSKTSIYKIKLQEISNKIIVIDASIFIYRFLGDGDLIVQMYTMISILLSYNIIPLFIFDGKTPPEKRALIDRRRLEKREATTKYNELIQNPYNISPKELEELRRKTIRLTFDDLDNVKLLLDAFGISYMRAQGEADSICAYLVKEKIAWGCMSDDMDLFLYGCPNVLRNINLYDHTITLYDTNKIFHDLSLLEKEFLEMVIVNGTDYNDGYEGLTLLKTFELIKEEKNKNNEISLYDTLEKNEEKKAILYKINEIFYIENQLVLDISTNIPEPDWKKIEEFMQFYGFIFI